MDCVVRGYHLRWSAGGNGVMYKQGRICRINRSGTDVGKVRGATQAEAQARHDTVVVETRCFKDESCSVD